MRAAGLKVSTVPALVMEGDPVAGFEYRFAEIVAEQDLHIIFCVTQTVNDKWMALVGFESETDVEKAALSLLLLNTGVPLSSTDHEPGLWRDSCPIT
jgi:hypothetical protein